jgi:hypothetical protein
MEVPKNIIEEMWTIEKIKDDFILPIEYCKEKKMIEKHIHTDLELDGEKSLYKKILNPKTIVANKISENWKKYYSSDTNFLKDTQNLYKRIHYKQNPEIDNIVKTIDSLQSEHDFLEKYNYVEWNNIKFLNNYALFLGFLSVYNICSPLFALCMPIYLCIIPYFILKMQGIQVTWSLYWTTLVVLFKTNIIGQLLTNFNNVSLQQKLYMLFSGAIYVFQIYNNIMSCVRFNTNMKKIHNIMKIMKNHIKHTVDEMKKFEDNCINLNSYKDFITNMNLKRIKLEEFYKKIESFDEYLWNVKEFVNLGSIMREFYYLYNDNEIKNAITYSFGFHGYLENITEINKQIHENKMNIVKYNNKKKTKFVKAYYPSIENKQIVKNDYDLSKNIIITGPNASGKTTLLKTTIINVLLSQQLGCGFYKKAYLHPYDNIHCYLNIPDTSGRDSLFQAEARRCKNILEIIETNSNEHNFCVFDELYSGTNPYEAVATGVSYIEHLTKQNNVHLMLTTHFIDLCKHLDKNKKIKNYQMKVNVKENLNFDYLYLLINGISKIKGGVKVLRDLNYPSSIIEQSINILKL